MAEGADDGDLVGGEAAVLDQQSGRPPAANPGEALPRISDATLSQRLDGGREHLQRVARRHADPARDGEQAVRRQPVEQRAEGFERIERTFSQPMQAARGGREGIQQRDLDDVVEAAARVYEAAGIGDMHVDRRRVVEIAGESGELAAHEFHHLRIELDRIDRGRREQPRQQDVGAAARAEDEYARLRAEVEG